MVSTIRFRSFKTFDLGVRRSYPVLILVALALVLLTAQPDIFLVVLAYTYLVSGLIAWAWSRMRRRPIIQEQTPETVATPETKLTKGL